MRLALSTRLAAIREHAGSRLAWLKARVLLTTIACLLVAAATGSAVWAAWHGGMPFSGEAGQPLTAMVPQGALLTIEAKDFAGLLKRWRDSPERKGWLASGNYSVFSNSRLFGRLSSAQDEFAVAAGLPPDESFLNGVAGRESVFAWYDIGKLQFLYITRMSLEAAEKTALLQRRGKFSTRKAGAESFYVRTQGDPEKGEEQRTVAFATSHGWLLLATREDLIAEALVLMSDRGTNNSVTTEPWFADAHAAAAKTEGDLRMTLNLEKIVPTPYFRSYWVQQNITQMKQYRGALADLYLGGDAFREERVLLPKSATDADSSLPDLRALTGLLPQRAGVYRAQTLPSVENAVDALNEALLQRGTDSYVDRRTAPDADLKIAEAGNAGDLESRIDTAPLEHPAQGAELAAVRQTLSGAELQGMMTVRRTGEAGEGIWVPFQSAMVLSSAKDWDVTAVETALKQVLNARLTSGGLGLLWKPVTSPEGGYFEISDVRPLVLAVHGRVCIVADDAGLMREMLAAGSKGASEYGAEAARATMIAGVDLTQERSAFARWTKLVDSSTGGQAAPGAGQTGQTEQAEQADGSPHEPAFFSENIRSLADAFAALDKEKIVERRDGTLTRQVVTYTWRH